MITVQLPSCRPKPTKPFVRETPLAALHVDFLACLNRVQRQSAEHVVCSERVPLIQFSSNVGRYIAANSHPMRVVLRSEVYSASPRDLGVLEAAATVKCGASCVVYCSEVDDTATERQHCEQHLVFLEQLLEVHHKGIVIVELLHITCALSVAIVALFAEVCSSPCVVHTVADDRCYFVGRWDGAANNRAKKGKHDISNLPSMSHMMIEDNDDVRRLEAALVQVMGRVYTWRCTSMYKLSQKVDEANSYSRVVNKQTQPWFDNLIDSAFPSMGA